MDDETEQDLLFQSSIDRLVFRPQIVGAIFDQKQYNSKAGSQWSACKYEMFYGFQDQ